MKKQSENIKKKKWCDREFEPAKYYNSFFGFIMYEIFSQLTFDDWNSYHLQLIANFLKLCTFTYISQTNLLQCYSSRVYFERHLNIVVVNNLDVTKFSH